MPTLVTEDASEDVQFGSIPSATAMAKENAAANREAKEEQQAGDKEESAADTGSERPDWLPSKFNSAQEMAQSYAHLEREHGRQSEEIGSLRKLTSDLATTRQTPASADDGDSQSLPEVTADDILNDPGKAIGSVVQHEVQKALAPVTESVQDIEASLTMGEFTRRHPTFQTDQNDPAFAAWVQADPIRGDIARRTVGGDLEAADTLFTAWENHRAAQGDSQDEQTSEERQAEETASAIASTGGLGGDAPKEYIRRSDLDHIMLTDRDRYDSPQFQKWMQAKYDQGLVK